MKPINTFESAWARCEHLNALHAYLAANVTAALQPGEVLRAEWAARVSALDLYVHELVAQGLGEIIAGNRRQATGFSKFPIDAGSVLILKQNPTSFQSQVDLEIRSKLERRTFQFPADIADAIRYISDVELWNAVALTDGATEQTKTQHAKAIKNQLTQIANRRNKIVHEADLQPAIPRVPWPISPADVGTVKSFIEKIVRAIDSVV
jgi:hypothetical protein